MTQILLGREDTSETNADIFTKSLTSTKLQYLFSPWYMLGVNRNNNSQPVLNVEFHRRREPRENCNFVDTGDFLFVVCSCGMSQALAFSVFLSSMRIAEARADMAGEILSGEINMTQCLSFVAACSSCAGTCEEAQKEELKVKGKKGLRRTSGQSVCTIQVDDEFHRDPDCEACRGKEYKKLNACKVKG